VIRPTPARHDEKRAPREWATSGEIKTLALFWDVFIRPIILLSPICHLDHTKKL
jgi:hypothetical protein